MAEPRRKRGFFDGKPCGSEHRDGDAGRALQLAGDGVSALSGNQALCFDGFAALTEPLQLIGVGAAFGGTQGRSDECRGNGSDRRGAEQRRPWSGSARDPSGEARPRSAGKDTPQGCMARSLPGEQARGWMGL